MSEAERTVGSSAPAGADSPMPALVPEGSGLGKDCDSLEPMPPIALGDPLQIDCDGVDDTGLEMPPTLTAQGSREPLQDSREPLGKEDLDSVDDPTLETVPTLSLGDSDPDPVPMKCDNAAAEARAAEACKTDSGTSEKTDGSGDRDAPPTLDKVDSSHVNGVSLCDKESSSNDKPPVVLKEGESEKVKEVLGSSEKVGVASDKPNEGNVESQSDKEKQPSQGSSSKSVEKPVPTRSSARARNKSVNYNENDFIPEIDADVEDCFITEKKKKPPEMPRIQNGLPVSTLSPLAPARTVPVVPVVSPSLVPRLQPPPQKPVHVVSRTNLIPPGRVVPQSARPAPLAPQITAAAPPNVASGVSLLNAKLVPPGTVYQLLVPSAPALISSPGPLHQSIASSVLTSIVSQAASTIQSAANNRSILQSNVVSSTVSNARAPTATPNLLSQLKTSPPAPLAANYKRPEPVEWVEPKSSWEMIELARFETGSKTYKKPLGQLKADADMSNITRFLFDIGLDCIKEVVYNDLINIQSRRKSEGKLKPKEEEDFNKLRSVHREVKDRIGHLRLPMNKKCRCGFRTESTNVLLHHKEFARHKENDMVCCHCGFETRQSQEFIHHMESVHCSRGQVEEKPAFFRCPLCPFETNQPNKMKSHKAKCYRSFKPHFNLNPSCLNCNEANFCLENIFYKEHVELMRRKQEQLMAAQMKLAKQQKLAPQPGKKLMPKEGSAAVGSRLLGGGHLGARAGASLVSKTTLQPFQNHFKLSPAQQQQGKMAAAAAQQFARQNPNMQYRGTVRQQLQTHQNPGQSLQQQKDVRALLSKMNTKMGMPAAAAPGSLVHLNMQHQQQQQGRKAPAAGMTVSELLKARYQTPPAQSSSQPRSSSNGFEVCEICAGYVKDRKALQVHFYYAHRIEMPQSVFDRSQPPLYCATCFLRFWTAQGLQKHIDIHNSEEKNSVGVAGKCIICSHRVPNILMHMRHVHNRDLNNFLKGFKCVFCGQFFSGQQPMEAHMAQAHGVVVKITGAQGERTITGTSTLQQHPSAAQQHPQPIQPQQGGSRSGSNQMVKGSVCVLCNLNFGRNVDLTRHCMKEHHTCMKCGMVVADRLSLERHVCLMSPAGLRNCTICGERGFHPAYYVKHLRDKHLRRCSVKVLRLTQQEMRRWVKAPPQLNSPDSPIVLDEDDDDEEENMDTRESSIQNGSSKPSRTAGTGRVVQGSSKGGASSKSSLAARSEPAVSKPTSGCEVQEKDTELSDGKKEEMQSQKEEVLSEEETKLKEQEAEEPGACVDAESGAPSDVNTGKEGEASRPDVPAEASSRGDGKGDSDSASTKHLNNSSSPSLVEDGERNPEENHTDESMAGEKTTTSKKRSASPDDSDFSPAGKRMRVEDVCEQHEKDSEVADMSDDAAAATGGSGTDSGSARAGVKRSWDAAADEEEEDDRANDAKVRKTDELTA